MVKIESELKFKTKDFYSLRKRLLRLGAKRISKYKEVNTLFRSPKGFVLRLRKKKNVGIITLKGIGLRGAIKRREEVEGVVPYKLAFRLLRSLGESFVYEKFREEWKLDGLAIFLDELPCIGRFVEIEGTQKKIKSLAKTLGLNRGIKASYPELLRKSSPGKKVFRF